jgi:hypothetical protein
MPIESGNAATLVNAYGHLQDANTQRGEVLSSGIRQVGGAIQDARKKMDENTAKEHAKAYIAALGGNPDAVEGGLESTKAEILRLHAATDAATQEKARAAAMAHDASMQQAGFENQAKMAGVGPGGQYNPENDPAVGRSSAEGDIAEARKEAMSRALGGQTAQLLAPAVGADALDAANPDSPNFDASNAFGDPQMSVPDRTVVAARAAKGPPGGGSYMNEALTAAMGQAGKPWQPQSEAEKLAVTQASHPSGGTKVLDRPMTQDDVDALGIGPEFINQPYRAGLTAYREAAATGRTNATQTGAAGRQATALGQQGAEFQTRMEQVKAAAAEKVRTLGPQEALKTIRTEIAAESRAIAPDKAKMDALDAAAKEIEAGLSGGGEKKMPFSDNAAAPAAPVAVDPAAKARFDNSTPEQKKAFLAKATPEQRAQVGQ